MVQNVRIYFSLLACIISTILHCDSVTALDPITSPTQFSDSDVVSSVNWCDCQFFAVGAHDANGGMVGVYQFDQANETASLTTTTALGTNITAVAWCESCSFLAAGGFAGNNAIIQIYSFDSSNPGNLETVGSQTTLGGNHISITALDWCSGCSFLAASTSGFFNFPVGTPGVLQVYGLDPHTGLTLLANQSFNGYSVDFVEWCSSCRYLAITRSADGPPGPVPASFVSVYGFDQNSPGSLTFIYELPASAHYNSIDWCETCSYLAAGGSISEGAEGIIDIYQFDGSSLALVTTVTIPGLANVNIVSVKWCQGCDNLAIVGYVSSTTNQVLQLYHFDSSTETLSPIQTYDLQDFRILLKDLI